MSILTLISFFALCFANANGEMFDIVFDTLPLTPPTECKNGCATWSNLAGDGNTRSQADVDKKWKAGKAPDNAANHCSMPSNDPSTTYWCYCKDSNDSSWGYCQPPTQSVPEQINIQHPGTHEAVVISFVTRTENDSPPVVEWWPAVDAQKKTSTTGKTFKYIETQSQHRVYYMHFVVLDGLSERTQYSYHVKSGDSDFSPIYNFTSLYNSGETRFAIFGDMGVYQYNNMGNLERDINANRIDTVIHLGDHAYNIADADGGRGDGYMNSMQRLFTRIPWIPVLGNHEYYDGDEETRYLNLTAGGRDFSVEVHSQASHMNAFLATSTAFSGLSQSMKSHQGELTGGVPSGTSRYYSSNVGVVHFVSLDFNAYYFDTEKPYIQPQLEWLAKDLAAAQANRKAVPWIVLQSHYPMYCTSSSLAGAEHNDGNDSGDENGDFTGCWSYGSAITQLRNDIEPLMKKYSVDLYFAGHEHDYESNYPVINNTQAGTSFMNAQAPIHFTTGAGGAPALDSFYNIPDPWTRKRIDKWGYGRVTANNTCFTYDHVINADDSIADTVVICKDL